MSYNAPIQQKIYRWSSSVIVINIYICCTAVIAMHSKPHRARNDVRASGDHGWGARGCSRKNYMQCENREGRNWMMLNGTSMKCIGKERVYIHFAVYTSGLSQSRGIGRDCLAIQRDGHGTPLGTLLHPPALVNYMNMSRYPSMCIYICMYGRAIYIYIYITVDWLEWINVYMGDAHKIV